MPYVRTVGDMRRALAGVHDDWPLEFWVDETMSDDGGIYMGPRKRSDGLFVFTDRGGPVQVYER